MMIEIYDLPTAQQSILQRKPWDELKPSEASSARLAALFGEPVSAEEAVRRILSDVRARGDAALHEWTSRLDGVERASFLVTRAEIDAAYALLDPAVIDALRLAARRIEVFHRRQPSQSWIENNGEGTLGQLVRPIESVGLYVPGGQAPLPSSLLMLAIPARVAGVSQLVLITPPQRGTGLPHPSILVAADIAGIDTIYLAGGAQAIGALAYGTQSVPRVDKICGPGNLFTTLAKRQVFGIVGIDGLPGPTETLVVADENADPRYVAADLLAQAEHDLLASAILLTTSRAQAEAVQAAVASQLEELGRSEVIAGSLTANGGIVLVESIAQAIEIANQYAPEHLCLLVRDPWQWLGSIRNAGGVFLGERSFEVLGDYVAGPSHVMPTGGTARFASPVNVGDFVKIISVIGLNEQAFAQIGPAAALLAETEGLTAHAAAVRRRLDADEA